MTIKKYRLRNAALLFIALSSNVYATISPSTCNRFWIKDEALIWWNKSAPVSTPLLSTYVAGSPSEFTGFGGELGQDGTIVLSPHHFNYNALVGDRLTVGMWLTDDQRWGLEASGFGLNTGTSNSVTISDGSVGSEPLRALFINPPPGAGFPLGESSFVLAQPGFASGGQTLFASSNLWGAELNALYPFWSNDMVNLTLSGGFRYLNLKEKLTITNMEHVFTETFGTFTGIDNFGTHNQFYSGQLGFKAESHYDIFFATLQGNLALGVNEQTVSLRGSSSVSAPTLITAPGGLFVQPSNIGTQTRNQFAVLPDVKVQLGANLTQNIRLSVGYDFMYLNNVVRPGDQIDRTINFTQNAIIDPPGTLTGPARPGKRFQTTDFWAQGVSVGLDIKL